MRNIQYFIPLHDEMTYDDTDTNCTALLLHKHHAKDTQLHTPKNPVGIG